MISSAEQAEHLTAKTSALKLCSIPNLNYVCMGGIEQIRAIYFSPFSTFQLASTLPLFDLFLPASPPLLA